LTSPERDTSPSARKGPSEEPATDTDPAEITSQPSPDEDDSRRSDDQSESKESEDTTYLVVWGQLTALDDLNVDLYTVIQPEERIYPLWELGIDTEDSRLNNAEELNHQEFLREVHLHYPSDQSYDFGDRPREIRATLIDALASPSRLYDLREEISSSEPEPVEDHFSELFEDEIFEESEDAWIKTRLASKSEFLGTDGELPDEWDESDLEDLDVIEIDDEVYDINLLPRISILSSVVSGIPAEDLSLGQEIRVRLTGAEVDNLPERLQDPRREGLSVPVGAEIVHTDNAPTLPPAIDGEPSNYRGVAVQFFEDIVGYGYIHLDERVQVKESTRLGSDAPEPIVSRSWVLLFLIPILLFLGLVILI
jgi:hypothetical protein